MDDKERIVNSLQLTDWPSLVDGRTLEDLLAGLSSTQLRFVVARQETATDAEAGRIAGVTPTTITRWPDDVQIAVRLVASQPIVLAREIRRKALAEAMQVKIDGLRSEDERLRQSVATEIIEWELGKAIQRQQIAGVVEHRHEVDVALDRLTEDELRALAAISDRLAESVAGIGAPAPDRLYEIDVPGLPGGDASSDDSDAA